MKVIGGMMEEDLSNRTITILVILTVTISVLGTLSVMNAVSQANQPTTVNQGPAEGKLSLRILPGNVNAEPSSATGMVGLELKEPEKKQEDRILLLPD